MSEGLFNLIDILLKIIVISLSVASPILILIGLMHIYDKYKKIKETETKEAERIIIKNNEAIVKTTTSIKVLDEQFQKLEYSVLKLKEEKRALEVELGQATEEEEIVPDEDKIDYSKMTIKELHDIAREWKVKGFSRMKKDKLVEILDSWTIEAQ